jgi:hypothetical protein
MAQGSFELTDERIDGILKMMKQFDPTKAAEYEKLRKSDPEALKTKLREEMQAMRSRMMQRGPGQGAGGMGGGFGGRQGRRGQASEGGGTDAASRQQPEGQNDR